MRHVIGPLQHPWTHSKTQSHTLLLKGAVKTFFFFLCLQKHIYLFPCHSVIYLFISCCPRALCSVTGIMLDDADTLTSPRFPPFAFNTAAVENQTAVKQIDVLFNIVVTSSQGPHTSALVTTAGLLSLAQRWLSLCWSLQ